MPSQIVLCILCGKQGRHSRSIYTTISTIETEKKVRLGYLRRNCVKLKFPLLDEPVHKLCYKSFVYDLEPVSKTVKPGRPRRRKTYSNRVLNTYSALNDITNHQSTTTVNSSSFCTTTDSNNVFNTSPCFRNEKQGFTLDAPISFLSNDDKENPQSTNKTYNINRPLFGLSKEDVSFIKLDEFPLIEAPNLSSLINLDHNYSINNLSRTQPHDHRTSLNLKELTVTSIDTTKENLTSELIEKNTCTLLNMSMDHMVDELDGSTSRRSASIPSKEEERVCSNTVTSGDEFELTAFYKEQPSAANIDEDDLLIVTNANVNGNTGAEAIIKHKNIRKQQNRSKRIPAQNSASSRYNLRGKRSTIKAAPPCPQTIESISLYRNGFEELCAWLFSILDTGSLVSMIDVTTEYELILRRRQQKVTNSMIRTTSIRDRLQNKFGDILHFEKISNYDGIFVALSDVSIYVRAALSKPPIWNRPVTSDTNHPKEACEKFIEVIEELRHSLKSHAHLFQTITRDTSTLINFDTNLYWNCVPLILKNFIGTLTLSDSSFAKMRREYNYYDIMNKDMYKHSSKWLKIASSCYDLIHTQNNKNITPKHYFLGNEIFRHERSKQLLTITNRLGHTPSYNTIVRLNYNAAQNARTATDPFTILRQNQKPFEFPHNFVLKIADNFDINPDTLYGNNSIHILNQIIISTPENDEIPNIVEDVLNGVLDEILKSDVSPSFSTSQPITTSSIVDPSFSYKMFTDRSLFLPLLAYGLTKYTNDNTRSSSHFLSPLLTVRVPLMSGFFATYLPSEPRPLHSVSFLTPINEDPSSESTAEKCLEDTKELFVDSNYQKEGILVVDEKIYRSCLKAKRREPDLFRNIFVYAGDFHLMKNMMIVIWSILKGTGIEDVVETIYKGATLRGIFEVHHFNKSLRCCKLVYTALQILWLEAFFSDTSSTMSTTNNLEHLKMTMKEIPSEFVKYDTSQKWFQQLLGGISQTDIPASLQKWTTDSAAKNSTFRLWSFILHSLLEPLFELYISVRTCNFSARNAALNRFAPIFFATNHRNYSRLCAHHLLDLQTCSSYLFQRMARSFAVTRSHRRFSSIALDQMIECTINKHGKGKGGINGRLNEEAIKNWTDSFAFRALAASTLHEICGVETGDNSIDSHVECSPNRQMSDDYDLSVIVKKLRQENLFTMINTECRKIQSGLVFHDDIISNITSLYERGEKALTTFINERLISKVVPVDAPLKAMLFLKFTQAATYIPDNSTKKKGFSTSQKIEDFNTLVKMADENIYRTIIIAQQRNLKPLSQLFAHEFSPVPFSLCDIQNVNLLNQQTKCKIIDFLHKIYSSSFYSSCPISTHGSAIVIDGGSLLETKPQSNIQTIRDYAIQLLENNIQDLFKIHDRIDVVFDSIDSNKIKMFTKGHENDLDKVIYHLKPNDKLEFPFSKFINSNRAALATCVKECWMQTNLIERLPKGRLLVVGGPDSTAIKLQNGSAPIPDYILESTHIEADTRIMLHVNGISLDQQHKIVFIQTANADIILLAIAFSSSIFLDHLMIKSLNTHTKNNKYIDVKFIATSLRRQSIDPNVLLVLHALSGCDSTSFIRNITKEKVFQRFFDYPARYSSIIKLSCVPPSQDAIDIAEQLIINCYSFGSSAKSLDDLRGMIASVRVKDQSRKNVAASLPPSTMAFHEHCLRCSRQLKIWFDSLDSHCIPPVMDHNGYEYSPVTNRFKIKWSILNDQPNDYRLQTCGECEVSCTRCKCFKNNLSCTVFCKCDHEICSNRNLNSSLHDQSNERHINEFELTTTSTQDDNEFDRISIISQSSSINNKSINESDLNMVFDQSHEDYQLEYLYADASNPVDCAQSLHIKHDHTYWSNNDLEMVTPKRRRLSSASSNFADSQLVFRSPCAHSSPKPRTTTDTLTQSAFRTPVLPIMLTPRRTSRFRKYYGTPKTRSQPSMN